MATTSPEAEGKHGSSSLIAGKRIMGGSKPVIVNTKGIYSKEQQAFLPRIEVLFLGCEESQGRNEGDATDH